MSSTADDPGLLLHHSHRHGLVLKELSENISRLKCLICCSSVKGGPAYRCSDCIFFSLHKSCAESPSTIQHPFHPNHPLELTRKHEHDNRDCSGCLEFVIGDQYHYKCDECGITLHLGCATATLPTHSHEHEHEYEQEKIQHIAHEHPLEKVNVNSPYSTRCTACRQEISGGIVYGCRACIFVLHESCALAPREIVSHPLHPQHPLALVVDHENKAQCRACRYYFTRFVYECNECDFNLDLRCAISIKYEKNRQEIHHFSHPHPLTHFHTKPDIGLACEFCNMNITDDFYCCLDCTFVIHKSCAKLPQEMVHPLHPHHHLICQTDSGGCSLCYLSDKFIFKCQECHFGLHPQCALQSLSASEDELAINIQHIHKHPMRLQSYYADWLECHMCQSRVRGLAYRCKVEDCQRVIHKSCAELPRESILPVHPQHSLTLLSEPHKESYPCAACHESCCGFTLACDSCKVQFHFQCAIMKPTLKHQRHEHSMTYFEYIDCAQQYDVLCNVCGNDCRIDIYRCVPCNYNVHCGCLSLPQSIKHEWHVHPMVLRDKYINEDFDYDEQYCDLCETVRHPEHGVYYCIECRCATHIDCVIPKLNLEKRKRMDDLVLRKLDEQISMVEAETEASVKEFEASRKNMERLMKDLEVLKEKRQEILSSRMQSEEESGRA